MKEWLCVLAAVTIALSLLGGMASAEQAEYPAVRIDPSTGQAWDLGGQTVYLYDYWTDSNWADNSEGLSESEQAVYAYRTWIQNTYNCTVVTGAGGDWGSITENVQGFAADPDGSLRVYTVSSDAISSIYKNALADWTQSTSINLSESKWNSAVKQFMTIGGRLLGVYVGNSEPRQVLFFNKRVLEEAGIDWNDLYDMQKNGTWTFSAFQDILASVQRDEDEDGQLDVYGITGSNTDLFRIAVFSNGGSFFDVDGNGRLTINAAGDNSVYALNWAKTLWNTYSCKPQEGDPWDYYKTAWLQGKCAFYIEQAYAGFNGNSGWEDWGCVAFPKGPQGTRYVSIASNNIAVIPNVYSEDALSKITLIYDLWTNPAPGYFSGDEWIGNKLDYTDERAVYETYAMLRDPENTVMDLCGQLGSISEVEGSVLLWGLDGAEDTEGYINHAVSVWLMSVNEYNHDDPFAGYELLILPGDLTAIGDEAFCGIDAQIAVIPSGCVSIGSRAFADNPHLVYVVMPESLIYSIQPDVFEGSDPVIIPLQ